MARKDREVMDSQAERIYARNLKMLNRERKVKITSELSELMRELTRTGIKNRHPEFSEEAVEKELWRIISK